LEKFKITVLQRGLAILENVKVFLIAKQKREAAEASVRKIIRRLILY